jgi:hypothetical protein
VARTSGSDTLRRPGEERLEGIRVTPFPGGNAEGLAAGFAERDMRVRPVGDVRMGDLVHVAQGLIDLRKDLVGIGDGRSLDRARSWDLSRSHCSWSIR